MFKARAGGEVRPETWAGGWRARDLVFLREGRAQGPLKALSAGAGGSGQGSHWVLLGHSSLGWQRMGRVRWEPLGVVVRLARRP